MLFLQGRWRSTNTFDISFSLQDTGWAVYICAILWLLCDDSLSCFSLLFSSLSVFFSMPYLEVEQKGKVKCPLTILPPFPTNLPPHVLYESGFCRCGVCFCFSVVGKCISSIHAHPHFHTRDWFGSPDLLLDSRKNVQIGCPFSDQSTYLYSN